MLSVPSSLNSSATLLRRPTSVDATTTTVTMPMTMPMMASAERMGCERSDSTASVTASWSAERTWGAFIIRP